MVSTIHATEAGRHSGWVSGAISRQVHAVESWLVRESDSLITCSASMSDEITELFGPGSGRNHRDPQRNRRGALAVRAPPSTHRAGRIALSSGGWSTRRVCTTPSPRWPRIRRHHPGTTLTIAGDGTQQDWLVEQARKHKVLKATRFVGHLRPRRAAGLAASGRRRGAAQPLRAVRARRSRGRRGRHSAGDVEHRWSGRSGDQRADRGVLSAPRRGGAGRRGAQPCSTTPPPRSGAPVPPANGSPPTSIGTRWPQETAQVYLAAKRARAPTAAAAAHRRARAAGPLESVLRRSDYCR